MSPRNSFNERRLESEYPFVLADALFIQSRQEDRVLMRTVLIGALLAEQNESWLESKYLDMQEYHEWAAACAAAREGNNVVALPG
ncbi:transposase [Methylococcus capsulatus]|uniref:Uncharacterized protein n=2 Tax=Methylococcus capsulatus TaxID=414 RepID=A0AA35USV3_METCP|nr:transposase [Methylococcus capsulatus]CAI8749703.1 protein of unknown function [Methylococcus capsulatus]